MTCTVCDISQIIYIYIIEGDQKVSVHLTITVNHQVHRNFFITQYIHKAELSHHQRTYLLVFLADKSKGVHVSTTTCLSSSHYVAYK
jgi:hypothetical protein